MPGLGSKSGTPGAFVTPMPITHPTQSMRRWLGGIALAAVIASPLAATSTGVAVLRSAPWSPGDTIREGAGEFEVLVCAAQLKRDHTTAGLVGIGDRHGLFLQGAERALRHLALSGIPVVKLASGGDLAADPEAIFLDASGLSSAAAAKLLQHCLERHGAPPVAANPSRPSPKELAAVRAHLAPFRDAFSLAAAVRVATN